MRPEDRNCLIGPHVVRLEPLAMIFVTWNGDVTGAQMLAMHDVLQTFTGQRKGILLLQDLAGLRTLTPEARKLAATDPRTKLILANACFGASFHIRVLGKVVERGIRLFRNDDVPRMMFFASEAQCRAFLAA